MHEFDSTEFHLTCCRGKILSSQQIFFAKTGLSHEENCCCNMSLLHVPATCPLVCACLYALGIVYCLSHLLFYASCCSQASTVNSPHHPKQTDRGENHRNPEFYGLVQTCTKLLFIRSGVEKRYWLDTSESKIPVQGTTLVLGQFFSGCSYMITF